MKLHVLTICLLTVTANASSTTNFSIGDVRNASGAIIADGGGTWAIIVSAVPGNPTPTAGQLPGGLTSGSSLTGANSAAIKADFDGITLNVGNQANYNIYQIGSFTSGNDLGIDGIVQTPIVFNIAVTNGVGFSSGTGWGFYWFPGVSAGATLSGSYEVGGFANSTNAASGGDWGTTIGADGGTFTTSFYETDFNQNVLAGGDTGLTAARFTAVAVPEPSTLVLSALGLAALLRRRRN